MNLNHLDYLIVISEVQSFTKAAEKLYVSQPSLSLCVKNIENELGISLFDRTTNPLTLTEAGKIYINWAKSVISTKERTYSQIKDITDQKRTLIKIGGTFERIKSFVMPTIPDFKELRPNCHIEIVEEHASVIQEKLAGGEIDISVGTTEQNQALFISIPISEEKPILAVPKVLCQGMDLPDEERPRVSLEQFKDLPFIALSSEQTYGSYFRRCCTNAGFIPEIMAECRMLGTLHNLVTKNVGAGFVTNFFYKYNKDEEHVRYFELSNSQPIRTIYISHRQDYYITSDCKALIEVIKKHAASI